MNPVKELQAIIRSADTGCIEITLHIDHAKDIVAVFEKLKPYLQHKTHCEHHQIYYDPLCPKCLSKFTHWRSGPHFDQERRCGACDACWEPERLPGKCNCGLDKVIAELEKPESVTDRLDAVEQALRKRMP